MIRTLTKSLIFTLVTVMATMALAATIRNASSGSGREFKADFTDVTSLNSGDDVRVAGVKVGTVKDIGIVDDSVARVTFTVSDAVRLPSGTSAEMRFRNLVGQRYIALELGKEPGPSLSPGYTFSVEETQPALDLTLLFNGFQPLLTALDPDDVNTLSGHIVAVFQGDGASVDGLLESTASLTSTLAEKDEVIGNLITSLSSVLTTVNDRTDQLDTTITTLQQLVSGLAQDRKTIGNTLDGLGGLSTSVAELLEQGRKPLKSSITSLETLSTTLAKASPTLDSFFEKFPIKLGAIGRIGSYGSWLNFYVCSIEGTIPKPEGYWGDLGVQPIAERCM